MAVPPASRPFGRENYKVKNPREIPATIQQVRIINHFAPSVKREREKTAKIGFSFEDCSGIIVPHLKNGNSPEESSPCFAISPQRVSKTVVKMTPSSLPTGDRELGMDETLNFYASLTLSP